MIMKKLLIAALLAVPMMGMAQTTLTPQEQLEQAQKQLQEAQAALEQAKANAAKAEADNQQQVEAAAKQQAEAQPQSKQSWTQPVAPAPSASSAKAKKEEKGKDMSKYTAEGAVPEVNGKVEWTTQISAPGLSAAQIYERLLAAQTQLTQGEDEIKGSQVALVNEQNHSIVTTVREWLTFSSSFLSLDRADCSYVLETQCYDGGATVKMSRIKYAYTTQSSTEYYTAEEWITDEMAVNKKHTRLYRISGKFRRATIDRKDAVFNYLAESVKSL